MHDYYLPGEEILDPMNRRLPSLNALRAFEAAGRHMSFSRAADELHVTPAAVGQQVRALESYLGQTLFVRLNRSVELTVAGQALLPGVSDGFDQIARTMEAFYRRTVRRPLTVSVEPNFGAKWLVRRLDRFRERHPGIEIRLDATSRIVDFTREAVDLAIRYGDGSYPGVRSDVLFEEDVFPVCSPSLLDGRHPLVHPEDLQWHQLLRQDWAPNTPTWPDWAMWLQAAGVENVDPTQGPQFAAGSYSLMMDAALAGQGVALASSVLAADDIEAGRLVKPFDLGMHQSLRYYLVGPEATADEPMTTAFREWVISEAGGPAPPAG